MVHLWAYANVTLILLLAEIRTTQWRSVHYTGALGREIVQEHWGHCVGVLGRRVELGEHRTNVDGGLEPEQKLGGTLEGQKYNRERAERDDVEGFRMKLNRIWVSFGPHMFV